MQPEIFRKCSCKRHWRGGKMKVSNQKCSWLQKGKGGAAIDTPPDLSVGTRGWKRNSAHPVQGGPGSFPSIDPPGKHQEKHRSVSPTLVPGNSAKTTARDAEKSMAWRAACFSRQVEIHFQINLGRENSLQKEMPDPSESLLPPLACPKRVARFRSSCWGAR